LQFDNKKVIIFDLDGTLIDSVPDLAVAVNYMLGVLKMEEYSQDTIRYWVGNGASTLVHRALLGEADTSKAVDEELFNRGLKIFLEYYAQHLSHTTTLYPNVKTTLQELKQQGFTLAIVTNKPFAFVEPILSGLGIDKLFSLHLGGDSLELKKPDPLPLLHVCEILNVSVDEAVMVGDSKNDILAANGAKMQSIGVSYGYNYGEAIEHYNPSIVVDDFGKILAMMEGK